MKYFSVFFELGTFFLINNLQITSYNQNPPMILISKKLVINQGKIVKQIRQKNEIK
jgi:hypothetical protein